MATKQPNILLVFTDQQRADTVGVRNPVMRTPVMDRLCAEGTLFSNAHTPVPVCVPARCSMMFGQYAHKTGCFANSYDMPEVTSNRPTFMSLLTEAGYQTHGVGKMHFRPDSQALRGFETRDRSEEGCRRVEDDDYISWLHRSGYNYVHDANGVRGEMYYVPQPSQLPASAHNSHWVADRSLEFLRTRDRSRPFLLWSSFIDPHPPFAPPVPWNKLYRAPSMPLPKRPSDMRNLWIHINRVQNRYKYRDAGIDDNLLRVMKAYYCATVSFIDYNVGRIVQSLEDTGELVMLSYVYAVLHSPQYRSRYGSALRDSYPRVPPTPSGGLVDELCRLGQQLVDLHLVESPLLDEAGSLYNGPKNPVVGRAGWSDGTVWLDAGKTNAREGHRATKPGTLGFHGVPEEVWDFHIGGYQVCHKWLKDRKDRTLSADDIAHYQKIVVALNETIRLIAEIDEVIDEHGGWPDAFATG